MGRAGPGLGHAMLDCWYGSIFFMLVGCSVVDMFTDYFHTVPVCGTVAAFGLCLWHDRTSFRRKAFPFFPFLHLVCNVFPDCVRLAVHEVQRNSFSSSQAR
jgi:hypothetical protein